MTEIKKTLVNRVREIIARLGRFFKMDMAYIASGAFWGNANYLFLTILALTTSVLFARYLTKDQYGTYQYVLSIAGIISTTTLTGMNSAVVRAVARGFEGELRRTVKFQIILGIIPTVISLGVAVWYLIQGNNSLTLSFLWVAMFLPLANALNTWVAYASGKKAWRVGTYYGFANSFISYAGVIAMVYFTRSFVWVAFGNFFFGMLGNFVMYRLLLKRFKPNDKTDPETIPYGTHLSLQALPGAIPGQLDSLLVYHFVGPAALAVYTFATLIPEKLSGSLKFASNLALPKFSERSESHVKKFLIKKMGWMFIIIGAVTAVYVLFAPFVFHIFFPAYNASIPFTQVYSLSFFSLIPGMIQSALVSQKKTKALYILSFLNPAIRTVLLAVLMYYFNVWGIVWAQIIQNFMMIPIQMAFLDGEKK